MLGVQCARRKEGEGNRTHTSNIPLVFAASCLSRHCRSCSDSYQTLCLEETLSYGAHYQLGETAVNLGAIPHRLLSGPGGETTPPGSHALSRDTPLATPLVQILLTQQFHTSLLTGKVHSLTTNQANLHHHKIVPSPEVKGQEQSLLHVYWMECAEHPLEL